MNIKDAYNQFLELTSELDQDDSVMLSEEWNNYTDSLCKDGELTNLQYHYCPAHDDPMPDNDIDFILECMDVSVSGKFIPSSDFKDDWKRQGINHKMTLRRGSQSFKFNYTQGIAHHPEYEQNNRLKMYHDKINKSLESGRYGTSQRKFPLPDINDCLESLFLDISGDLSDFVSWCDDYGYDCDSRKAHKIFKQCIKHKLKLDAMFTDSEKEDLNTLFQEM